MKNINKRILFAYSWHGFFLALTMSMIDLNTILPSMIDKLNGSKLIFGVLYSILLGAPLLFNLFFSYLLKKIPYSKNILLIGIYLRGLSFLGIALTLKFVYFENQNQVIPLLTLFLLIFSITGGFAGLSYSQLMGKTVKPENRAILITIRQFLSSIGGLLGGFYIAHLFKNNEPFPTNYVITMLIGFVGLFIASIGFFFVKELPTRNASNESLKDYLRKIPNVLKKDSSFKYFVIVENISSVGVMMLPFYMLYAREIMFVDDTYIGIYLISQIIGMLSSNLFWGVIGKINKAKGIFRTCLFLGSLLPILSLSLSHFDPKFFTIVFFLIGFLISGRKIGFESTLLNITPENKRFEYLGLRGTLNISIAVLPLIGSQVIQFFGYNVAFISVFVLMFISFILSNKISEAQSTC